MCNGFSPHFADGWPGAGLLMQRLLVGAALLYCVVATPAWHGCGAASDRSAGRPPAHRRFVDAGRRSCDGVRRGVGRLLVAGPCGYSRRIGGAGRDAGADRARRVVRRCPALRQEAFRPSRALAPLGCPPVPAMTLFPTRSYDACASRVQADARVSGARPRGAFYFPLKVVVPS